MSDKVTVEVLPAVFSAVVNIVRGAVLREELQVTEITAPSNLAPFSIAFAADVVPAHHTRTQHNTTHYNDNSDLAMGRFVLLYDPSEPDAWGGAFRVVCYAKAPLETDIGTDPFLADVTWSWLIDALETREADYIAASGTATKILSTGYGGLAEQGDGAQIELRASWTPTSDDGESMAAHIQAWGDLVCMLAGLPPTAEGVALLSARRKTT